MRHTLLAILIGLGVTACMVGDDPEPIDPIDSIASEDYGKVCGSFLLGSAEDACDNCNADACEAAGCAGTTATCKGAGPYGKKCVCESAGPLEQ